MGKDESLTSVERSPFWRMGVLSVFISKLLCKTNLADSAPFENYSTHFFRLMCRAGARDTYAESSADLLAYASIDVSGQEINRMVQRMGPGMRAEMEA